MKFEETQELRRIRRSLTMRDSQGMINQAMHYGGTNIPRQIIMNFVEHYQRDHIELEQIWEAYQALLHDQALEAL